MAFEHNMTPERLQEALEEIGHDVWVGYGNSTKCIGWIITDEGNLAQIQIVGNAFPEDFIETDIPIPEYED